MNKTGANNTYYGANSTLYYQGFAVTDGASAVNMMVNWNGELKGPNGAFIRIKDDSRTTWSNWRELVFKDFSDSIYTRAANVVPTALPTFYGQDWNSFNGTTKEERPGLLSVWDARTRENV